MLKHYLHRAGQIPTSVHPFVKRESSRQLKPPCPLKKSDFVLTPYINSSNLRATYQILNTVIPYVLLWILAVKAFEPAELVNRLQSLVQQHEIYRIKGFVAVPNKAMRLVVQGVGNRFDTFYDRPWQPSELRQTRLVFIGRFADGHTARSFDAESITAALV